MKLFDTRVQLNRLETPVQNYEKVPIEKGLIMFYGASSFTRWKAKYGNPVLEEQIRKKDGSNAAINHGFGSSTAEEELYYYDRLVKPWEPRVLIIKTGGNDAGAGYSPMESVFFQSRIMEYARADVPGIRFILNGIHPNKLSAGHKNPWRDEYNELLQEYAEKHDDCIYTNYKDSPLFFDDPADVGNFDKVKMDIYAEDQHHYNYEGFCICAKYWLEVLDEYL